MSKQLSSHSINRDTGKQIDPLDDFGKVPPLDYTFRDFPCPLPAVEFVVKADALDTPIKYEIRYLYGPLDGRTRDYYSEHPPEHCAHPLIWTKTKTGIHADITNDYAVYLPSPEDPCLMVFYGIEHREIDITKGEGYIVNRHWITNR